MQNTDFFKPRNSGYGWDKRYIGIMGDVSQTQEFQLHGVATEFDVGNVRSILFYSDDKKDAVLNPGRHGQPVHHHDAADRQRGSRGRRH